MKFSRIRRQQNMPWEDQGFGNLRPLRWGKLGNPLPAAKQPEPPNEPPKWPELPKTKRGQNLFPLKLIQWWRERSEVTRFAVVALLGIHIALALLRAYYAYRGQ